MKNVRPRDAIDDTGVFFLKNVVPSIIYVNVPFPSYNTDKRDVGVTAGGFVQIPPPVFVEVYKSSPSCTAVTAPLLTFIA